MPRHLELVEPLGESGAVLPLQLEGALLIGSSFTLHLENEPAVPLIRLEDDEGPDFSGSDGDFRTHADFEGFDYQEEEEEKSTHE